MSRTRIFRCLAAGAAALVVSSTFGRASTVLGGTAEGAVVTGKDGRRDGGRSGGGARDRGRTPPPPSRSRGDERSRSIEQQRQQQQAQDRARRESQERTAREAQDRARREAQERAMRESQERAAQDRARNEADDRARREAQERAMREADDRARREVDERSAREAQERARRDAMEQEARDRQQREAFDRAQREAQERNAAREQQQREALDRAKREAEQRSLTREQQQRDALDRARQAAEERAREQQERLNRALPDRSRPGDSLRAPQSDVRRDPSADRIDLRGDAGDRRPELRPAPTTRTGDRTPDSSGRSDPRSEARESFSRLVRSEPRSGVDPRIDSRLDALRRPESDTGRSSGDGRIDARLRNSDDARSGRAPAGHDFRTDLGGRTSSNIRSSRDSWRHDDHHDDYDDHHRYDHHFHHHHHNFRYRSYAWSDCDWFYGSAASFSFGFSWHSGHSHFGFHYGAPIYYRPYYCRPVTWRVYRPWRYHTYGRPWYWWYDDYCDWYYGPWYRPYVGVTKVIYRTTYVDSGIDTYAGGTDFASNDNFYADDVLDAGYFGDAPVTFEDAWNALSDGDLIVARDAFSELIDLYPFDPEPLIGFAISAGRLGEHPEAIDAMRTAVDRDPGALAAIPMNLALERIIAGLIERYEMLAGDLTLGADARFMSASLRYAIDQEAIAFFTLTEAINAGDSSSSTLRLQDEVRGRMYENLYSE